MGLPRESRWFLFNSDGNMLLNPDHSLPNTHTISEMLPSFIRHFSLGEMQNIEYFCAEWDSNHCPGTLCQIPLKQALTVLLDYEFGLGVKGCSIIHWDKNHRFCSRCGAVTEHKSISFTRMCPQCQLCFFPRISPSIIVLIKKGEQLLMARSPHFAPGVYGLIAGFVEVGETLEEAVHREVKEEVGLKVTNLTYFGSQPWPFPDSLMIAFLADYDSGEIEIDHHEIEAANWYRFDNLPGRPSTSISIASAMIDYFVTSQSYEI